MSNRNTIASAGGGRSSVEAWYSTALDIVEVLSGAVDCDIHLFVADVVESFDTVDRGILDFVLERLGLLVGHILAIMLTFDSGLSLRRKHLQLNSDTFERKKQRRKKKNIS